MLLFHIRETDTLDGVLRHHDQVLGSLGAPMVTTPVVDIKEVALAVDDTGKDCGMVLSLIKFLVCCRNGEGERKERERGRGRFTTVHSPLCEYTYTVLTNGHHDW